MIRSLPLQLWRSLRLTIVLAVFAGLVYTYAITGVAQVIFPNQAGGSLVTRNGQVVGSSLIAQQFKSDRYFHPRPSANGYAADNSAGSNLAPSNQALIDRVASSARTAQATETVPAGGVPVDYATTDFSGFDPDVTEATALIQVDRVAKARGIDSARERALVESHVQGRILWVFGEPHVNVLELNLALDDGRY